ncbi:hypothetical protein J6N69_05300 [bacterium]|nr:hypothetical protein [bacterium]MBP3847792.1 hypothetical protein [bacterium]
MKNKCTKFEGLFTFGSEDDLLKHIDECEVCKQEYERMQKVSSLVQEVKPYYKKKKQNSKMLKIACSLLLFAFLGTGVGLLSFNTDISDTIKYGTTLSAEDLGFPVDSYGLIMVE